MCADVPTQLGSVVPLLQFRTTAPEHRQGLDMGLGAALAGWGPLAPPWSTRYRTGMSPASPLPLPQLSEAAHASSDSSNILTLRAHRVSEQSLALISDRLPGWE